MTLDLKKKEIVSAGVVTVRNRTVIVEMKRQMLPEDVRALNKARLQIIKGIFYHGRKEVK